MSAPRHVNRQPLGRSWRVWDLDAETRYWPVVDALPPSDLPICEVGSGSAGLASWTTRSIIGVDPGADERHTGFVHLENLRRVVGDGASIPLDDHAVCAAVAIDTFEHISPAARDGVVAEMIRVTAPGGRLIINGPTGPDAAAGDRWLTDALARRGPLPDWSLWLEEHFENGLPTDEEMAGLLQDERVVSVETHASSRSPIGASCTGSPWGRCGFRAARTRCC
jgi:SAM-dependent methyltransferase